MNVIQIMEQKKTEFTPNDQLIYQKISKDPGKIVQMTTSALSDACGVSQPALTRFVKGLGYTRYPCRSYRMACRAEDTADAGL